MRTFLIWLVIIGLLCFVFWIHHQPKPQPVPVIDFPDTEDTVLYNVTIEHWENLRCTGVIHAKELRIKKR